MLGAGTRVAGATQTWPCLSALLPSRALLTSPEPAHLSGEGRRPRSRSCVPADSAQARCAVDVVSLTPPPSRGQAIARLHLTSLHNSCVRTARPSSSWSSSSHSLKHLPHAFLGRAANAEPSPTAKSAFSPIPFCSIADTHPVSSHSGQTPGASDSLLP